MSTVEESVAGMIGDAYSGKAHVPAGAAVATETGEVAKFEFDEAFQTRVAALCLRDSTFMMRARHLIRPEYFENGVEAALVNTVLRYWDNYRTTPSQAILAQLIRDDVTAKIIRGDIVSEIKPTLLKLLKTDTSDQAYVADKVAEFVRHQAVGHAILSSVELLERGQFDKIEKAVKQAIAIGTNEGLDAYNYFERIEERTKTRIDKAAGVLGTRGITTGNIKLDELLYHRGWGRRELVSIMGGAKAGKTTALLGFAKAASLAGFNVLYVTLEVAASIISDRLDACMSGEEMASLLSRIKDVESKVKALAAKAGMLTIHEYPTGTLTPAMLEALLERYRGDGINFDLLVVDYADIMAPNHRTNDAIENSKSVYVDLRAICQKFDLAGLTATQTNREGMKSAVATMVHVSDDINKVRIVDLMISINITDEERSRGEARLFFAASRNQAGGFTLFVKQDIARMRFIESIIRIE